MTHPLSLLAAALLLTGCSIFDVTTPNGTHIHYANWSDNTNETVYYPNGKPALHRDATLNSNIVRAHYHGLVLLGAEAAPVVGPAIGIAPRVVAPAVPAIVSGMTQPPRATPAPFSAASVANPTFQLAPLPKPNPTKP